MRVKLAKKEYIRRQGTVKEKVEMVARVMQSGR